MAPLDLAGRLAAPRIAVLGPPAVGPPEALRPLGGRPARALIALTATTRPCTLEDLADAVWSEARPSSHRAALHVHLGTLRRALADIGAAVVRRGDGYVLDPGPCEVDAQLAADLLDAADDDPELVQVALALWRGMPFAVDGESVVPAATHHLDALRRDAEELAVEVLLQSGDARSAEGAARTAVEAEPLREHRWGQLLRARYLAGRTGDALATYQEARAALIDALGIEPGPELRALEAAALTHDVKRLRLPAPPEEVLEPIPAPMGDLVGREEALRQALATITATRRLALLGPPGVGKSRLAVELARMLGGDGAWVDVAAGVDAAAVADWTRRHPDGVVVLDGAHEAPDVVDATAGELARSAPTVTVVATSRVPLADLPVQVVGPLDDEAAVLVLQSALRDLAPSAAPSSSDLAALAHRAGGLPLALRLTAAAARTLPIATIVALPASGAGDEVDRATRDVLDLVGPEAREAFHDLSVLSGAFDLDLAAGVTELGASRLPPVIVELADHGLLHARPERSAPYTLAAPLRAVGERLLADRRDDVLDRYARSCLGRARAMAASLEAPDLEGRLLADLPRHWEALEHLARRRDAESALTLVCHLDLTLYALGRWAEKEELLDRALAIPGRPSAMRARAHALRARPGPLHRIDVDQARQAEDMAGALGHESLRAFARFVRSLHLMWSGHNAEAAELFHEVQQVFEREERSYQAYDAQKFFGVALVLDGDADAGLEVQREALAHMRRDHPSPFPAAHGLAFLGHSHRLLGDDAAALADWTEGRTLAAQVGNRATASHMSIGLAELAVERGEFDRALALTAEALDLIDTGHAVTYAPWAWTVAVRAHGAAGDLGAAIASARRAVASLDDGPSGEAVRLGTELAEVAIEADDPVAAARLLGVVAATPDLRELPFPSPAETARREAVRDAVQDRLGDDAAQHVAAGERCSVAEAAGRLLAA